MRRAADTVAALAQPARASQDSAEAGMAHAAQPTHSDDRADRAGAFFRALAAEPYRYDFFQALRRIEALFPRKPRLGEALRPGDEPVRLGQEPSLSFAPATLSSFRLPGARTAHPRMEVRFFGLLGPNGPLPLHLTEYARERLLHSNDPTLARFLDVLHHRFLALFYRAWAQAQPTVSLDRPADDRFAGYVGSLFGLGSPGVRHRDAVPDVAKLFYSGLLVRHVRNAEGLAALLSGYFRVPVRVEQYVGHWMALPERERTCIGVQNGRVGRGATLGRRVWDRQHKFRIWFGPLTLEQYERFLPGGSAIEKVLTWVRQYCSFEFEWDMRLVLKETQVPRTRPGSYGKLGWTTWLGHYRKRADAADLILRAESRHA
jgi:type VI secretion system protein ImpH